MSDNRDHTVPAWCSILEDYALNRDYTKIGPGIYGGIDPKYYADLHFLIDNKLID